MFAEPIANLILGNKNQGYVLFKIQDKSNWYVIWSRELN